MGWLWSSAPKLDDEGLPGPSSTTEPPTKAKRDFSLTEEQRMRIFGRPGTQQTASDGASREEQADAELDAFLKSFSSPSSTTTTPSSSPTPEQPTPQPTPTILDRNLPDGSINIHPTALYPRTMSCRQAFDQAFYCQSLGGKFNDIYRYGHLKDCSEQWGAFWFCMRTRTLPSQDKEAMIREYYAERDERRRKEVGSSEAIWDIREKVVEKAFWKDPDADDEGHAVQIRE